jgi:hypothetical protein
MRRVLAATPLAPLRRSLALGVCSMVLLGPPAVMAQEAGHEKPKYGTVHLGPVYFSLSVPFSAGVDDNVYNTPLGVSDETASITPTLQAVIPLTRHARIRANGGIVPQYFHRESSERHTDIFGDTRGEIDVGPITAFGGIGAGRYFQRFSLEIDQRLLRHQRSDTLGATLRAGKRIALTGSQSTLTSTFDPTAMLDGQAIDLSLDRATVTRRLELKLPVTRKTSFAPWADTIEDRFVHPLKGLPTVVKSQRYAVALQFGELAFFTGSVAAGIRHFAPGQGVAAYNGPFLFASLTGPFFFRTHFALSMNRDVTFAAAEDPTLPQTRGTYVSSTYRLQVLFDLPFSLLARLSGGYAEADYLAPVSGEGSPPARRDHLWSEGGALLRRLGRHLSLGVSVQRDSRISPIDGRTYSGLRFGLAGEANF